MKRWSVGEFVGAGRRASIVTRAFRARVAVRTSPSGVSV